MLKATQNTAMWLHSAVTGNTVRINPLGQLVWHLRADGVSPADFVDHLPDGPRWCQAALDVVRELATLGFLFADEPVAGSVSVHSRAAAAVT